jgi:hypothetical protein
MWSKLLSVLYVDVVLLEIIQSDSKEPTKHAKGGFPKIQSFILFLLRRILFCTDKSRGRKLTFTAKSIQYLDEQNVHAHALPNSNLTKTVN